MIDVLQQVLNGLSIGALYGLVLAGLALIIGVLGFINFAQGSLFTLGAYVYLWLYNAQWTDYLTSAIITVLIMVVIGVLFESVVAHPVITKSWQIQIVVTIAIDAAIMNGIRWQFGAIPMLVGNDLARDYVEIFGLRISVQRLLIIVVALVCFGLLKLFLNFSMIGKTMRAVAQNRRAATIAGVNLRFISILTFAIGAGMVGIASALIVPVTTVYPDMGIMITMKAFAMLVVVGWGSLKGSITVALSLGVVEALGTQFLPSSFTDSFIFIAMFVILLVRPRGLFVPKTSRVG